MTQRSAFVLHVHPDRIDEYVQADRLFWLGQQNIDPTPLG